MIESSETYRKAIVGTVRQMALKAVVEIVDPDIAYGSVDAQSEADWSRSSQLHNKMLSCGGAYATLERNRWLLDGTAGILADETDTDMEIGYVSGTVSDEDGAFPTAQWVRMSFSNLEILQACSVYFPEGELEGRAVDFTVEVLQGGTVYYSRGFTGNQEACVSLSGFTVYAPDAVRVTVSKWSLPGRRMRVCEILPGIYEQWGNDAVVSFDVKMQGAFSCLSLPYSTAQMVVDNLDRRFEPRNKEGLFKSIEERQGVELALGTVLEDGSVEYKPLGVFYQYNGGWKTSNNDMTMTWNLVDIIGLLADRTFIPPTELPDTLGGWLAALAVQLGENFADKWSADEAYSGIEVSVRSADDVADASCGDILLWACMASGTWPRADAETGKLTAEPLWDQGNAQSLDNLEEYPTLRANSDLAAIIFKLNDGDGTQYVVSGNATAASSTVSVDNPFIKTETQALAAARMILSAYGGNVVETTGRGDPSSEIGDVATVQLDESSATTARIQSQSFGFQDGVLRGCKTTMIQANGSFLYQNRAIITQSGSWTAPAGVSSLRIIVVGGGDSGACGGDGSWQEAGLDGADGAGGKVYAATINCNEQQVFAVTIGAGGVDGESGEDTTLGLYTSASGKTYTPSYTDVASGDAYAREGVELPLDGSGDGGRGGKGGVKGNKHTEYRKDTDGNTTQVTVIDNRPGSGKAGSPGAAGCVVIYWDK